MKLAIPCRGHHPILANQTDANGISIAANALALNGGSIADAASNAAVLTHSLVADNGSFMVDILANQTDANGISISANSLSLNSGTIKDAANNNAVLSHSLVADNGSYMVDTTAPTATTAPTTTIVTAAFSADTGSSSTDFITKTAAQTISGTLSANLATGETVAVSLDNGSTWTTATTTVGQNTWSLSGQTLTASNTLKVKVSDAAGNDGTVYSHAYTLDTVAPTNTIATAAFSADTGSSSTDLITQTAAQDISGTLSSALASDETVKVSLDNGSTWTTATTTVGQNTWSLAGQTISGSNTLKVKVSDAAGNDGTVYSQAFSLDNTAPSAPGLALTTDTGSSNTDNITKAGVVTVSGVETGATWQYSTNGGNTWSSAQSDTTTIFTLTEGVYATGSVQVRQTDAAGNLSTVSSSTSSWTIDTTKPTAPSVALTADTGTSGSDGVTQNTSITVTGLNVGETWQYSADGGWTWSATQTALSTTASFSLSEGIYGVGLVQVRQTDLAGNTSNTQSNSSAWTIDTTAPTAPSLALAEDTGSNTSDGITSNRTVNVSAPEAGATWQYSTNGGTTWSSAQASTTTSFDLADGTFAVGAVQVRQTDLAGNVTTTPNSNSSAWTIDTTIPTVTNVALTSATGAQNNTLNAGDVVTATVTVGEVVTVDTTHGTPTLSLTIGNTAYDATYDAVNSTSTALKFNYTTHLVPAAAHAQGVAAGAVHHQLVVGRGGAQRRAAADIGPGVAVGAGRTRVNQVHTRHVHHVLRGQGQGVGGGVSGQVDALDAVDAAQAVGRGTTHVFDGSQIQVAAALGKLQGIEPSATQHPRELRGVATCTEHVLQGGEVAGVEHKGGDVVACGAGVHHAAGHGAGRGERGAGGGGGVAQQGIGCLDLAFLTGGLTGIERGHLTGGQRHVPHFHIAHAAVERTGEIQGMVANRQGQTGVRRIGSALLGELGDSVYVQGGQATCRLRNGVLVPIGVWRDTSDCGARTILPKYQGPVLDPNLIVVCRISCTDELIDA